MSHAASDDDSVIMISIGSPTTVAVASVYNFYYVMGFSTTTPSSIDARVKSISVTKDTLVEVVFAKGVHSNPFSCEEGWTEQEWDRFIEDGAPGIRVQTSCPISNDAGGAACIDRLIDKHVAQKSHDGMVMETMLDYYRAASGGRMHHLDKRPWRMSTLAVLGMEYELHIMKQRIDILHRRTAITTAQIQYTQEIMQCAVILCAGQDANHDMLELIEQDMHKLEAQEAELVTDAANLHDLVQRNATVLLFQLTLPPPPSPPSLQPPKKRARVDL
jgi:hypothetical protein